MLTKKKKILQHRVLAKEYIFHNSLNKWFTSLYNSRETVPSVKLLLLQFPKAAVTVPSDIKSTEN